MYFNFFLIQLNIYSQLHKTKTNGQNMNIPKYQATFYSTSCLKASF